MDYPTRFVAKDHGGFEDKGADLTVGPVVDLFSIDQQLSLSLSLWN